MTGAAPAVIGRAGELTAVQAVVDAAAQRAASALLIRGCPILELWLEQTYTERA